MAIGTIIKQIDEFLDKPRKMTEDMTEAAMILYIVRKFLENIEPSIIIERNE